MQGELVLAIETSVEEGSVALVMPGVVVREIVFQAGRTPSACLWEPLQELMEGVGELAGVIVGTGPGSYNGSRVGIAAGQGIALVKGCPLAGLSSFEGTGVGDGLAVGDARRGSFSLQRIVANRLDGPVRLVGEEEFVAAVRAEGRAGGMVFSFEKKERYPGGTEVRGLIEERRASAGLLGLAFLERSPGERQRLGVNPVEPSYLREAHITESKKPSLF